MVSYRYQGLSTPVCATYSDNRILMNCQALTLTKAGNDRRKFGAEGYCVKPQVCVALDYTAQDALDRFGRITDHAWKNSSAQDLVRIKHGYDRIGNRLYREDLVASILNQHFDELYSYDEINQVTGMTRGQLNATKTAIVSDANYAETFAFDATGNWTGYNQDTNGDGTFELNQLRTHNAANELTAISNSTSNITTDANGNMTKVPKPETWGAGYNLVYDGWNRLVEVIDSLTINLVAQYEYNGLNHRVLKKTYTNGNLTETREFFFNKNWQCLEEYLVSSDPPTLQYTWGQRYIDDLICRDRDTSQNGTLNERLYSLADPNWNVVAVMDEEGTVQERTIYSAFGKPSTFTGDFATVRSVSAYNWTRTFTGQVHDNDTGIMLYRNRYYHPTLGRFVTRDPIGYEANDINLLCYIINTPLVYSDSMGLSYCVDKCSHLGAKEDIKLIGSALGNANAKVPPLSQMEISEDLSKVIAWIGKLAKKAPGAGKIVGRGIDKVTSKLSDSLQDMAKSVNGKLSNKYTALWLYYEATECVEAQCCIIYTIKKWKKVKYAKPCTFGTDTGFGIIQGDMTTIISPDGLKQCIAEEIPEIQRF